MCEDALARLRLLQVVVDRDERLDCVGREGLKLDLAVMQRLSVRMAPLGERAELTNVDGQRLIRELHELGEIEKRLQDLKRHVLRVERRLERSDEGLLVPLHAKLAPTREERRVEQLTRQRLVSFCERCTRAQRR